MDYNVSLAKQLSQDYLAYSMAVILGRAIPDFRDGLKPVSRRILYGAKLLNLDPKGKYLKSARLTGEVMGKLHPHGSSYGAMVTMSQHWTSMAPLLDGHGNWGSPTDGAASERYTEVRTSKFAWEALLSEEETWGTKSNYDGSLQEPVVLNAQFPNILAQSIQGVAVGYTTSTITHSLKEIYRAFRNPRYKLYPDSPTGCDIIRDSGLEEYMNTGRGSIKMRAKYQIVDHDHKRKAAIFTNLPLGTNTEKVCNELRDALESGKFTGVKDVVDGTDKTGIRLTVVFAPKVNVDTVLAEIFRYSSLEYRYSAKLVAIHKQTPRLFSPRELITEWMAWRRQSLAESCQHKINDLLGKIHLEEGHHKASLMIPQIVAAISDLKDLGFSQEQSDYISSMSIKRLVKFSKSNLEEELEKLRKILNDLDREILNQVRRIATEFGKERQSQLVDETPELKVKTFNFAINEKRGAVTEKGDPDQILIAVLEDGLCYRVRAHRLGYISGRPQKVLFWFIDNSEKHDQRVCLYSSTGKWNSLSLGELSRSTSSGSKIMPDLVRIGPHEPGAPEKGKGARGNGM